MTRGVAANVAVTQDTAGNLKPAKDKSTEWIDGIVATIMAIGRAIIAQENRSPSTLCSLSEEQWIVTMSGVTAWQPESHRR